MKTTSPETHLLRELHVLASAVVLFVAIATASVWGLKIGPSLLVGTFSSLFAVATLAFGLIAVLRTRKLKVRVSAWSALLSGLVNAVVFGSVALAFRIWYLQWPFNQELIQPENYIDDGGASWLITLGLISLSLLIWILGLLAVGATSPGKPPQAEASK